MPLVHRSSKGRGDLWTGSPRSQPGNKTGEILTQRLSPQNQSSAWLEEDLFSAREVVQATI